MTQPFLKSALPIPPHFDGSKVGQVWRVPYEQRAAEAESWAAEHHLRPTDADIFRLCLLAVDVQNTFCIPEFELYVGSRSGTGAVDDNRRLCEFIYRNLGRITTICPTLDTHQAMQIFHALFFVDAEGKHPAPYTRISLEDVEQGRWKFNPALAEALGVSNQYMFRHLEHYTATLQRGGKYALTVWPYHAMLGGIGHALVSAFEEAVFFHSLARRSQPQFQIKSNHPLTEHYSVIGPEVQTGAQGEPLGQKNTTLLNLLANFDAVVIAGQAKSHCVAWTIQDLLSSRPELAHKVYLLEDCTSPVVVPGAIDYTEAANAAFENFARAGMHVVRSTDPIAQWPGLALPQPN